MKRTLMILAAAALVAVGPASAQEKVVFKLMGGIGSVAGEDYNSGVLGAYRLALDTSASLTGSYKTLSSGPNFQAEIVNYWGPNFGVGIGGGYYRLSSSSGISGAAPVPDPVFDFTSTYFPKFTVLPFFVNVHYKFQVAGGAALEGFAGPVFQVLQFGFRREATSTQDPLAETETFNASDTALGIQAGISASWRLSTWLSVIADGLYRTGKFGNIKGNWFLSQTTAEGGTVTTSNNSYYFWSYDLTRGSRYSQTGFFDSSGPAGDDISNARKGRMDMSGFVILAGLKFSL